jgi:hypothetical protein
MADLEFYDGFDHYSNSQITRLWTTASINQSTRLFIQSSGARTGNCAVLDVFDVFAGNIEIYKTLTPTTTNKIAYGFAVKTTSFSPSTRFATVLNANGTQLALWFKTDGTIRLDSAATLNTTANALATGQWNYIELIVTIAGGGAGVYDVRVNGDSWANGTGTTNAVAGTSWNQISIQNSQGGNAFQAHYFDDLYVHSCSGSAPYNTALGDCIVQAIFPTANATYSQWVPSSAVDHYTLVDDNPPNDDTDYVKGNSVGDRDSYSYVIPAAGGNILGISVTPTIKKDDAGTRKYQTFYRTGSTNYDDGVDVTLSQSYAIYETIRTVDPATSVAWTSGTKEFGLKVSV